MMKRLLAPALIVLAAAAAHAQISRPKAEVAAVVEGPAHPGDTVRAALEVTLPEGLHTQSNAPNDPALIPTTLRVDAPPGVTVQEIVWPRPIDLDQAGAERPLSVFERRFLVGVRLSLASSAPASDITVPAALRYQACDANLCYPPATVPVNWVIHVVAPGVPAAPDPALASTFAAIAFGSGDTTAAPASAGGEPAEPRPPAGDREAEELEGFSIAGTTGGYQGASDFLEFIRRAEAGVQTRGMFEGRGPLAILLLVLVGGLALNLTPCVLPMIPINLAIIGAGAQAQSRGRGFLLGSAYGGAMAVVYGVLGLVVVLTAGTFGTINSSPWFNLGIAILFVVLGLAMFDLLLIDFSKYSTRVTASGTRGSVLLAFTMGAVAALLAGACVAPVVIQVVLFSSNLYASGTTLALALPFCLGLGMAIPWPIAGAGLAALPRPGVWMVRVKQAFGVFIIATAMYYGYEAYTIFANRWVDPEVVASSVQEQLEAGWHSSLADGLAVARREHKPVLIDVWATWCKNCLTMDRTTLANADVKHALADYVKVKYQAEDPDEEPARSLLRRLSAAGLPAYAILKPDAPPPSAAPGQ